MLILNTHTRDTIAHLSVAMALLLLSPSILALDYLCESDSDLVIQDGEGNCYCEDGYEPVFGPDSTTCEPLGDAGYGEGFSDGGPIDPYAGGGTEEYGDLCDSINVYEDESGECYCEDGYEPVFGPDSTTCEPAQEAGIETGSPPDNTPVVDRYCASKPLSGGGVPRCRSFQMPSGLSLLEYKNLLKSKLRKCVLSGREVELVDGNDTLVGNPSVKRVWEQLNGSFVDQGTIVPNYINTTYKRDDGRTCYRAGSVVFSMESDATYVDFGGEPDDVTAPIDRRKYTLRIFAEAVESHGSDWDASRGSWNKCMIKKMNDFEERQLDTLAFDVNVVKAAGIDFFKTQTYFGKRYSNQWPASNIQEQLLQEPGFVFDVEDKLIAWLKDKEKSGVEFRNLKVIAGVLDSHVKNMSNIVQAFSGTTSNNQLVSEGQKRVFRLMKRKMASDTSIYSCFPVKWLEKDIDRGNLSF